MCHDSSRTNVLPKTGTEIKIDTASNQDKDVFSILFVVSYHLITILIHKTMTGPVVA